MTAKSAIDFMCPKCGAGPAKACRTRTGFGARTHSGRFKAAGLVENHDTREQAHNAVRRHEAIERQKRHQTPQWYVRKST